MLGSTTNTEPVMVKSTRTAYKLGKYMMVSPARSTNLFHKDAVHN